MDRIITKTKYSRKEYKKFVLFPMFHRQGTIYFTLVLVAFLAVLAVMNIINQTQGWIFSVVLLGVTSCFVPFMIISKINEVVKQETAEKIQSTDTIEISKHKLTRSNDITPGKAVIGWNNIDCVCENDQFIYIYNTDNTGIYLKKADFVEGTVEDFRKLAYDNLTRGKKGKINYKRYGKVAKAYRKEQRIKKAELKAKKGKK